VTSSSGFPGEVSVAQARVNDIQLVLNALHHCNAMCSGIRIFDDGKCPCSFCGGRGTSFRSSTPCETCKGTGKR
jgi:DnaJ-class molecular chaperone